MTPEFYQEYNVQWGMGDSPADYDDEGFPLNPDDDLPDDGVEVLEIRDTLNARIPARSPRRPRSTARMEREHPSPAPPPPVKVVATPDRFQREIAVEEVPKPEKPDPLSRYGREDLI